MSKSVLIVDDEEDWAETILRYEFEQMGYIVRAASDLKSARKELDKQVFSLVTIDMRLGKEKETFEGEFVLAYIRDNYEQIPCIIISGSPLSRERIFSMSRRYPMIPDAGYIEKTKFDRARLRELVDRMCRTQEDIRMSNNAEGSKKKLEGLSQELRSLSDRMAETKEQYDKGLIDFGRYNQIQHNYGTKRYEILDKMQTLMQGTGFEHLSDALEKAESREPEETIKAGLKEEAEKQGWGDHILQRIEEHKGEIASLIVGIAIELGKRAALGM